MGHHLSLNPSTVHYIIMSTVESSELYKGMSFLYLFHVAHHSHIHIAIFSPPSPSITLPSEIDGDNLKECKLE
jgi:hypothetical protein